MSRRTTSPAPPAPPRLGAGANLSQQVVANLSARIAGRELVPGTKLPTEAALAAAYGVSRTVVREALSQLQAAGLAATRHGIGTFVLEPRSAHEAYALPRVDLAALTDVISLLELRLGVETEGAALAAARRTPEHLAGMRAHLDALAADIGTADGGVNHDLQFHMTIARATGNALFADLIGHFGTLLIPRARVDTHALGPEDRAGYLGRVNREHEDIYGAIVRGDADAARAGMRTHLSNSRERLRTLHASLHLTVV